MVTPNETIVSSEVDSSPEVTDSLSIDGDQPLVPADWDSQQDAEVATEEVTDTGDETASDESDTQPEETSDPAEAITAETEQAPEATTETAPTEGETPEPRTYSQEERNNQESAYRRQFAEQQQQITNMQAQMARQQDQYQTQLVDAEVRAYTSALETQYQEDGMDEGQAKTRAQRELAAAKQDWLNTQENQQLKQRIAQTEANAALVARNTSVEQQMQKWGVPEAKRHLLQGLSDPELLMEIAEDLGNAEKLRKEIIAARQAEVPNGAESGTFDSPAGAASGMTDTQWLDAYSNDRLPDTTANDERAFKILSSRGMAPQI